MIFCGEIYKITNLVNKKIYIGKTAVGSKKRWRQHKSNAFSPSRKIEHYLYRAMRKYGIENFMIEVIDTADSENLLSEKEKSWIASLGCFNQKVGYNCTVGGDGALHSESSRNKIGRKKTPEQCAAISEREKGKKVPIEHIMKMVVARKGRKETLEGLEKRKASLAKFWSSPERRAAHREKIIASRTPEVRKKISESGKRRFAESPWLLPAWKEACRPKWSQESRRKRGIAAKLWWENNPEAKERNRMTSDQKRLKCAAAARLRWDRTQQKEG